MTLQPVVVALDYGRKRIGIAVSSPLGTVHPRPRLNRRTLEQDLGALRELVLDANAAEAVLGLPHNMDGTISAMEREVREFAKKLAATCDLPVFGVDERLTSAEADDRLKELELDGRERTRRIDSAAACILLEEYKHAAGTAERLA